MIEPQCHSQMISQSSGWHYLRKNNISIFKPHTFPKNVGMLLSRVNKDGVDWKMWNDMANSRELTWEMGYPSMVLNGEIHIIATSVHTSGRWEIHHQRGCIVHTVNHASFRISMSINPHAPHRKSWSGSINPRGCKVFAGKFYSMAIHYYRGATNASALAMYFPIAPMCNLRLLLHYVNAPRNLFPFFDLGAPFSMSFHIFQSTPSLLCGWVIDQHFLETCGVCNSKCCFSQNNKCRSPLCQIIWEWHWGSIMNSSKKKSQSAEH